MKYIITLLLFLIMNTAVAQNAELNIAGSIFNSPTDTLYISQVFEQGKYKTYDTILLDEKGILIQRLYSQKRIIISLS